MVAICDSYSFDFCHIVFGLKQGIGRVCFQTWKRTWSLRLNQQIKTGFKCEGR